MCKDLWRWSGAAPPSRAAAWTAALADSPNGSERLCQCGGPFRTGGMGPAGRTAFERIPRDRAGAVINRTQRDRAAPRSSAGPRARANNTALERTAPRPSAQHRARGHSPAPERTTPHSSEQHPARANNTALERTTPRPSAQHRARANSTALERTTQRSREQHRARANNTALERTTPRPSAEHRTRAHNTAPKRRTPHSSAEHRNRALNTAIERATPRSSEPRTRTAPAECRKLGGSWSGQPRPGWIAANLALDLPRALRPLQRPSGSRGAAAGPRPRRAPDQDGCLSSCGRDGPKTGALRSLSRDSGGRLLSAATRSPLDSTPARSPTLPGPAPAVGAHVSPRPLADDRAELVS